MSLFSAFIEVFSTIALFLVIIGILIVVHEWGHFLSARLFKVQVEIFSVGFGPSLKQWRSEKGTFYRISLVPLGGYVKMKGDDLIDRDLSPSTFTGLPPWKRNCIAFAGPLMNFLTAYLLSPVVFWIGEEQWAYLLKPPKVEYVEKEGREFFPPPPFTVVSVDEKPISTWEDLLEFPSHITDKATVQIVLEKENRRSVLEVPKDQIKNLNPPFPTKIRVIPDSPAQSSGMRDGDQIVAINGTPTRIFQDIAEIMDAIPPNAPPPVLTIKVQRGSTVTDITVIPRLDPETKMYRIGIQADLPEIRRGYSFFSGIREGILFCTKIITTTFQTLKGMVTTLKGWEKNLGGPITIGQQVHTMKKKGVRGIFLYIVFLSIQLAIFNLLPIPILDGGHLLLHSMEWLIRRPIPSKVILVYQYLGLIILTFLLAAVTKMDLLRILSSPSSSP